MIALPQEIRDVMRAAHGSPVRLTDPDTQSEYVVVSADVFDRVRTLVYDDGPLTIDEQTEVLRQAGLRGGWEDPEMDIYNDLDPRRST
jgi:bifunctional DNA-binding transcriptional regulator/antitoxin component of YhaV-PrlF toxin-antitoxin module